MFSNIPSLDAIQNCPSAGSVEGAPVSGFQYPWGTNPAWDTGNWDFGILPSSPNVAILTPKSLDCNMLSPGTNIVSILIVFNDVSNVACPSTSPCKFIRILWFNFEALVLFTGRSPLEFTLTALPISAVSLNIFDVFRLISTVEDKSVLTSAVKSPINFNNTSELNLSAFKAVPGNFRSLFTSNGFPASGLGVPVIKASL